MDELTILWTTDNADTAHHMVFLYGENGIKKGWWSKVTIIIWGAAASLAGTNSGIRKRITEMMETGVQFQACVTCADHLGMADRLRELGVEVKKMGAPLTEVLKDGRPLLTV